MVGVTEGREVQAGCGDEAVDEGGPYCSAWPGFDHGGELVKVSWPPARIF